MKKNIIKELFFQKNSVLLMVTYLVISVTQKIYLYLYYQTILNRILEVC